MSTRLVQIGIVGLSLIAACTDHRNELLAPKAPEATIIGGTIIGIVPPKYPSPDDFVEIGAGASNSCARKYSGDVYCWGWYSTTPKLYFQGATQIAVGARHACALTSNGAAYCWGGGDQGQLGYAKNYISFNGVAPVTGPTDPSNPYGPQLPPLTFNAIAAGANSTCGTTSYGVYCWGDQGLFPKISSPGMPVPTLITNPNGYAYGGFTSLAVGASHACGYAMNQVSCWGSNKSTIDQNVAYQTGVDPVQSPFYFYPDKYGNPTTVVIFAATNQLGNSVARVSTQQDFTCADMLNGTVECFGYNADGELGSPGKHTAAPQTISNMGVAMQLHGVSAGWKHACALDPNNYAYCWGSDGRGQLGNGQPAGMPYAGAQQVGRVSIDYSNQVYGNIVAFRSIAAGGTHSCGIGTDNHIYCWGDNQSRQLGRDIFNATGYATFTVSPVLTM